MTEVPHATSSCRHTADHGSGGRSLRVLVFTTVFPSPWQPLHGLFVRERTRHLARSAAIRVIAPVPWYVLRRGSRRHEDAELDVSHPRFYYVPRVLKPLDGLFLFLSVVTAVTRLRRQFDFDIIDAHFTFPDGCAAALLSWWFSRPFTITERGTLIPLSQFRWRSVAANWALRRASRVIAVGQELAERVGEAGITADRIAVIPNGVDLERFRPRDRAEARRRLGIGSGRLIVSVGHLTKRKGFHHLVGAMAELRSRRPDLCCAIVGGGGAEGNEHAALTELIRELGVKENVRLSGPRPHDEVAWWLGAADAVVLASDYEGCPNVIREALACGCPVVATRVGEVERMVPEFAGILIPLPCDAPSLASAIDTALSRTWDRAAVREYAARLTWDEVAARVLVVWRRAAGWNERAARAALVSTGPRR